MKLVVLASVVFSAMLSLAQTRSSPGVPPPASRDTLDTLESARIEKLSEPQYPLLARQARIQGSVRIALRLLGCSMDPNSVRLISGHPMLAQVALSSVRQSTIVCDNHENTDAVVVYDFSIDAKCHDDKTTSRVFSNRVAVRGCAASPPPAP